MNPAAADRLPWGALLALAMGAFITILTEALPAGLLPQMAQGLGVSPSMAGQTVTVYAVGSLATAIPLTAWTQGMRRRGLLLAALAGFAIANAVTTFSPWYALTMVARFLAGVSAGLLWALLAGYAARMVAPHLRGRAIAVAMVGTPLALSLGVPAGAFLGNLMGWRACFGIMSVAALLLIVWVRVRVPDYPGQSRGARASLGQVLRMPGVRPVLFVVLAYVLAHNILYTYIAPFLDAAGMPGQTDRVLLVFGLASLVSIWIAGTWIDRHLRALTLASTLLFAAATLALGLADRDAALVYVSVAAWGLAFGGVATLLQTALAIQAGAHADVAQSMLVTSWNTAIAGGGLVGGLVLDYFGVAAFAPVLLALLAAALIAIVGGWPRDRQVASAATPATACDGA
ncbi:MFS transporter [Bordetella genomosp. 1]|uniref:MFS transporter n=1 Tax=Bordetella genomosp. 1 TaxID=1395607 RepID=A0ABX4EZQ1_9BORD|nr:MFS transporter [Bordetella genomosp. 1]OZI64149.1 MFS transporter [Bordetella genomosp. 1]